MITQRRAQAQKHTRLDPWLFVVQNPAKPDAEYNARIVQQFGPWLRALDENFQKRFVVPGNLVRRADQPWNPIVILASDGDFGNYSQNCGTADWWYGGVFFDTDTRFALTNVDPFAKTKSPAKQAEPLLHEAARLLLQAYYSGAGKASRSFLVVQGVAAYSSFVAGNVPASLESPGQDPAMYSALVRYCGNKKQRNALIFPLQDLAEITDWESPLQLSAVRAKAGKFATPKQNDVSWAAASQASAWVHFLQHGANGMYAARFLKLVTMTLQGLSGADAYRVALGQADLAVLDREFWAWVYDQNAKLNPKDKQDRTLLEDLFTDIPTTPDAETAGVAKAAASSASALQPFDPKSLLLAPTEWEARASLGLSTARAGDLSKARAAFEALAAGKPPAPWDGRVAREVQRLSQAVLLRDSFFDALRQRGARLTFEREGKKYNLIVASLEQGELVFGESKQGLARLPVTDIALTEIVKQAAKKEDQGGAASWTRAYLQLLAGDVKWDKLLGKDESPEARALRDDARDWHETSGALGAAAEMLAELSDIGVPKVRARADRVVVLVRELMDGWRDQPIVATRRAQLERQVRTAFDGISNETSLKEFVHCDLEDHGDGTVTLSYDPSMADAYVDFAKATSNTKPWFDGMPKPRIAEAVSACKPSAAGLEFEGRGLWRLGLAFEAPLHVRVEFHHFQRNEGEKIGSSVYLLLCETSKEKHILVSPRGGVRVVDTANSSIVDKLNSKQYFLDTPYSIELTHDGREVSTTVDEDVVRAPADKCTQGHFAIYSNSDYVFVLQKLEIKGKLAGDALSRLRSNWAAAQTKALGF